ncbi:hypothetical protein GCM10020331_092360 [Ectobacillus funiculus]
MITEIANIKIIVDGTLLKHPNVYTVLHSIPGETDGDLQTAVVNLHKKTLM